MEAKMCKRKKQTKNVAKEEVLTVFMLEEK